MAHAHGDSPAQGCSKFPNALIHTHGRALGPYGIATYVVLRAFEDPVSHTCYPAVPTLADLLGISRRKVVDVLHQLEALQLIHIQPRHDGQVQRSNLYTFLVVEGAAPDAPRAGDAVPPPAPPAGGTAPGAHELKDRREERDKKTAKHVRGNHRHSSTPADRTMAMVPRPRSADHVFTPVDAPPEPPLAMGIAADPAVADHGSALSMANGKRPRAATPATPSPQRWRRSTTNRTPVPDDFVLTEAQWAWAAREVPGLDVERETKKFLNHFRGTGDRKADWGATWRNWMYRAQEFQGRRSPPPQARNGLVL